MTEFTMQDLQQLLVASAGAAEDVEWDSEQVLDMPFDEIGYDSLALLEMAAKVQQNYGIPVPDDAIAEMKTPRTALTYLNGRLSEI
jgi:act minimal PKS acyl carrier protein